MLKIFGGGGGGGGGAGPPPPPPNGDRGPDILKKISGGVVVNYL